MKRKKQCCSDSSYGLSKSPYAKFRKDTIYYEFDEVVVFVFKTFISTLRVAAFHLAVPVVSDECREENIQSPLVIQKRIEETANMYLKNTATHISFCDNLSLFLTALLVQTNEMRDAIEKCGDDIEKVHIDEIMNASGIDRCLISALSYYHRAFDSEYLTRSSDEIKHICPTITHFTIDSQFFVETICGIVLTTYLGVFRTIPLYRPLPESVKDDLCACIFPIFAELNYDRDDFASVIDYLKRSRESNQKKMQLACRYSQISNVVIAYLNERYNAALEEGGVEADKFVSEDDTESLMNSYLEELRKEQKKTKNLENIIENIKNNSDMYFEVLNNNLRGVTEKTKSHIRQNFKQSIKYADHYLMNVVSNGCKEKLSQLLDKLEMFRVVGDSENREADVYHFDLEKWDKKQIYSIFKDIRSCLIISKCKLGDYLMKNTNIMDNPRKPYKKTSLNTILNQI